MSKSLTADMPSEEAEIKAAIKEFFVKIEREHEKMKEDQEEIERLKARTRAILAQLEVELPPTVEKALLVASHV